MSEDVERVRPPDREGRPAPLDLARSVLARAVVLGAVWVAVTEADAGALGYAPVGVAVAVAVSLVVTGWPRRRAVPPARALRRAARALSLAGWVLARSVVGGVDVARRALHVPRADIDPSWTTHTCSLPTETSRTVFAFVLNLMPGTLSANLHGEGPAGRDVLDLHVISPELDAMAAATELERRFARVLEA